MSQSRCLSFFILLASFVWCAGILLAPLLVKWSPDAGLGIYAFYGEVCHQLGERSLMVAGRPLAVCTRCFSIYHGFLIGAALVLLLPGRVYPPRGLQLMAVIAILPMLLDVGAGMAGLWTPSTVTRLFTGGWFGVLSSLFLVPLAVEALSEIFKREMRGVPDGV